MLFHALDLSVKNGFTAVQNLSLSVIFLTGPATPGEEAMPLHTHTHTHTPHTHTHTHTHTHAHTKEKKSIKAETLKRCHQGQNVTVLAIL